MKKGKMMKAVNIEHDEKAVEAAQYISQYCSEHPECRQCMFSFSHVCILKWTKADQWNDSIAKIFERRKKNAENKL